MTNSERRISRQRPFRKAPGEAKPDWWIVSQVARRMGYRSQFDHGGPADIFAEHVALSAFENDGKRDFDLSGLIGADYEMLEPVQWPVGKGGTERMFEDGRFFTQNGRARLVPVEPPPPLPCGPGELILNTGRVRDHWHTMTRTGLSARLSAHIAEPFVEIHPADAAALGIRGATLVRLSGQGSTALVRALVTDRQSRGSLFVPMHWTDQFGANARVDALVAAQTDPVSGQPALKMARVRAEPAAPKLYGFFVSAQRPAALEAGYWALARAGDGWRGELAWFDEVDDWGRWLRRAFGLEAKQGIETATDARAGRRNFAVVEDGRLIAALFVSRDPVLVARQWAAGLLDAPDVPAAKVLAGRPGADMPDPGATICSCHGVGINTINAAIVAGCSSVAAVGAATRAGTNCGSCRAEIGLLLEARPLAAAE